MLGKRLLLCLLFAAIVAVFWFRSEYMTDPSESGPRARTRVVFVTGGSDDFWTLTVKGAEAAAGKHNAELQVEMLDQSEAHVQQSEILINLQNTNIDGIAVSPLDAEGQTKLLNRLADKMKVVTFDSDAPLSERHYYIGTSNYSAGKICGELLEEALPEGGKVAVLIANLRKNNMIDRKAGFEESVDGEKWNTVAYLTDLSDTISARENNVDATKTAEEQCIKNIKKVLTEHEDLGCIVGMNGYHGPLLRKVLAETGHLNKVKLVVFDWAPETLDGIETGEIYGTVAQDPYLYGYKAVETLTDLHNAMTHELPLIGGGKDLVPCKSIRKDDLVSFRDKIEARMTENGKKKS
jgi:ribose transport system substrate-binding protein